MKLYVLKSEDGFYVCDKEDNYTQLTSWFSIAILFDSVYAVEKYREMEDFNDNFKVVECEITFKDLE